MSLSACPTRQPAPVLWPAARRRMGAQRRQRGVVGGGRVPGDGRGARSGLEDDARHRGEGRGRAHSGRLRGRPRVYWTRGRGEGLTLGTGEKARTRLRRRSLGGAATGPAFSMEPPHPGRGTRSWIPRTGRWEEARGPEGGQGMGSGGTTSPRPGLLEPSGGSETFGVQTPR